MNVNVRNQIRRQHGASGLNEFALVFLVLMMIVFPLINLCGLACGYATLALATFRGVTRAAAAPNYEASLDGMEEDVSQIATTGLGRFVKLKAAGGFRACGSDLYTVSTSIYNNSSTSFGPNVPPPPPINSTDHVYEFQCRTVFDVGPIVSMASVPLVSSVPGLGKPARLTCAWNASVEHPLGLTKLPLSVLSGGASALKLGVVGLETPGTLTEAGVDSGWNYPNIYQLIHQAGQEVVSEDVLQVFANNGDWTNTNVDILPGQKVWIDLRADGVWNNHPNTQMYDADGQAIEAGRPFPFPAGALVGNIGRTPLPPASDLTRSDPGGTPFLVGKYKLNLAPPGTGRLYLIQNDSLEPRDHRKNEGVQNVRIIVTI